MSFNFYVFIILKNFGAFWYNIIPYDLLYRKPKKFMKERWQN